MLSQKACCSVWKAEWKDFRLKCEVIRRVLKAARQTIRKTWIIHVTYATKTHGVHLYKKKD